MYFNVYSTAFHSTNSYKVFFILLLFICIHAADHSFLYF